MMGSSDGKSFAMRTGGTRFVTPGPKEGLRFDEDEANRIADPADYADPEARAEIVKLH